MTAIVAIGIAGVGLIPRFADDEVVLNRSLIHQHVRANSGQHSIIIAVIEGALVATGGLLIVKMLLERLEMRKSLPHVLILGGMVYLVVRLVLVGLCVDLLATTPAGYWVLPTRSESGTNGITVPVLVLIVDFSAAAIVAACTLLVVVPGAIAGRLLLGLFRIPSSTDATS
jgi:hypothetical protein